MIRQDQIHDNSANTNLLWSAVLSEENGEVAQESINDPGKPTPNARLLEELIHVAAVATSWVSQILESQED